MSKITNDGLTPSGTCFVAVPTWQQWALTSKGQRIGLQSVIAADLSPCPDVSAVHTRSGGVMWR